jgi:hypothetical protein
VVRSSWGQPYTVSRLQAIEPGQVIIYYRGHVSEIALSGEMARHVLTRVFATAEHLRANGRVRLEQRVIIEPKRGRTIVAPLTHYAAIGI